MKTCFVNSSEAVCQCLNPIRQEALISTQLMYHRHKIEESVDSYAQELQSLLESAYGKRTGMDDKSKEVLKRDLFTQGLELNWQEKVLPSAKTCTLADALNVWAAEEQEKVLSALHPSWLSRSHTNNISWRKELPTTPPVIGKERGTISKDSTFNPRD